jgi:hypothetical protein
MSAAVLGLEVDGVTGQAYLIPFAGKAQLVIGYKGFNTLAARSGITITGAVVREGDEFDYELGSNGYVRHKPLLNGKDAGSSAPGRARPRTRGPPCTRSWVDELLAVKAKSPGAKRSDSPWNDPTIGYPGDVRKDGQAPPGALDAAQHHAACRALGRGGRRARHAGAHRSRSAA